jgi:hypothetical protein
MNTTVINKISMRKEDKLHDILEAFEIGQTDFDETKTHILILFGVSGSFKRKPTIVGNSPFIKALRKRYGDENK